MPKDASGRFHLSSQRASAFDRAASEKKPAAPKAPAAMGGGGGGESQGGAHEHLAAMHAESGGKHMHVHQGDEGGYTSHHVGHDGQVEGPHEHGDLDSLKSHMDQFFDGESQEGHSLGHDPATSQKDVY